MNMDNRIIVIDDEQKFLDSIRKGLASAGFNNLKLETDSRKAADLFYKGETYDVALIDISMPGMSGLDLLEFIKNTSPNTECIMVCVIDEAKIAVACLKKGAYDYLVKPIIKDDLVLSVNRALERKRLLDNQDIKKEGTF